jgi:hypothetical protein
MKLAVCHAAIISRGDIAVPLGDGGDKKFNWASELST